ncbi:MAG: FG-GAP-like repeat-containing protein, partial [ANME-2 cluster archaeon]|nr:FG-GAP-like repeat-containing protein [ANME-2 cluster archaeon]
ITARVTPGSVHDVRITKLDTFTIDYRFLVMMHVNRTGFLDTPLNPRAYVVGNIIYAQPGDMLTSSHTTDITKFLEAGSNSVNFVNDRNALVNYIIQTRVRDWNFTQETVVEIPNTFEIENVLFAAATDQNLMNPEIRHPLKLFASNLTVYDIDNNTDITASCTVTDNELFIPTDLIGPINAGDTRLFNVSYDAPRPNISPSLNISVCNRNDTILISAEIEFYGVPMTDANVSVTIANSTNTTWQGTLTHTGGGTYTALYQIPSNATLGMYNVTIAAYNDSTNRDDEMVSYQISQLTITPFTSGPFVAGKEGPINGNVNDSRTDAPINGATVEMSISNQSGLVNQSYVFSNGTGYFSFVWNARMAGEYNLTITANDSELTMGMLVQPIAVEYDVVVVPNRTDYNVNYTATLNVSVHDLGSIDVPGAHVSILIDIPGIGVETLSTDNGRLSYISGMYTGTFNTTATMGTYNYTVNVSTVTANGTITGIDTSSFRVSDLSITEMTEKLVYPVDENVTVWGRVKDLETGLYIENGTYNISIFNSSGFVTSHTGNIVMGPKPTGATFYDEDTFEVAGDDWGSWQYEDPVRDSSTAFAGSWSLHMTWPGTTAWGGQNFNGASGLETGQTSAGYSTSNYPYLSMAYRISPDDKINMFILVNGAWRSIDVTQGINTTGSYPTVATWGSIHTDDQWHWTQINLDEQLDASMGTGNHQITGIAWYPNYAISTYLTGDFWIDEFRISNISIINSYKETFSGLPADPYTAVIDISYLTLEGSNSSEFTVNYDVNTSIPSPLYSVDRDVDINISVFDTGSVPVTGANLTVNITNSTGSVKTISGSNITDNNNGYYNTTYSTEIEGDFNISVHVEKGSAKGDANLLPFRVTQFYVDIAPEFPWYEVGDNVTLTTFTGRIWDLQGTPKWANVTIQVFDPVGVEVHNIILTDQFDNFTHSFSLGSTNLSGTYSIQVNASEIESGGNLAASNTSSLNVDFFVDSATNRSQYNTDDTVNVTLTIKNSTTDVNGASVDVNVTYLGPSDWWNASYWSFDRDHRVGISAINTLEHAREDAYVVVRGLDLASAGVSLTNLPINSSRVIAYSTQENLSSRNEVVRVVFDRNSDGYLNTDDEIIFLASFSANESKNYWLYYEYDYDIDAYPEYTIPAKLRLYIADEFIISGDDSARIYYKHSNKNGAFDGYVQIDDNAANTRGIAIADFDNDGDFDVVAGDSNGNLFLYSWTNVGTFSKSSISPAFTASSYTMDMATADFDEDGNMDLIVGGNNRNLYLYTGDGTGSFTRTIITTTAPGTAGRGKDAGDVNEDGHVDFIYTENPGGKVYAYYGNGAGTFAAPVELLTTTGTDPYSLALGDFNNDGHLDVISNGDTTGQYHIYRGDGTGNFSDEGLKFTQYNGGMDAFDFDHDGNIDVVYTHYSWEYIYYRPGNGNFGFGAEVNLVNPGGAVNMFGISAPPLKDTIIPSIGIEQNLSYIPVGSGTTIDLGNGNYTVEFSLSDAQLGIYLVETGVTSPWPGDDDITFFVRSLNDVNNTYGPHNMNGTHQSPILPLIVSGTIRDSEFNNTVNTAYANITIRYPNNTIAAYQSVTTDASGIFHDNLTPYFSSSSPAGIYNVTIIVNDGGILYTIETNLTFLDVHDSWVDPGKDYRTALILDNTLNHTGVNYNGKGFVIDLPGGVDQTSVVIKDINGIDIEHVTYVDQGGTELEYTYRWDDANTLNITHNCSLGMFEGRLLYVYFDRDLSIPPDNTTLVSNTLPVIAGAIEGYWMTISTDQPLYTPPSTASITANLTLANGTQLTGSRVNFSIYYPNQTLAYGPHNNSTDPFNITINENSYTLHFPVPDVNGVYTIRADSTAPNGIPRTENATFNVGGLRVTVDTDKTIYNTRDDVWFTVNVEDVGDNATVTLDVNDPSGQLPYEFSKTWPTNSTGTALIHWPLIPITSVPGNYTIAVNINTANDTGYNGSKTIEIDSYVTTLDLTQNKVSFDQPVTASGITTHNGSEVSSWVNISVTYQSAYIDDAVPYGASTGGVWTWDYNTVHSGSYSHLQEVQGPATAQHYFYDTYSPYRMGTGENISVWVYLDPLSEPIDEIMVQVRANNTWNNRAYWGSDTIQWGTNNTTSRQYIGPLPASGAWYELALNSTQIGLDGQLVEGMAFAIHESSNNVARVWFDEVTFEHASTHDPYLENQNVSSPYSYVISNTFTETFNDAFMTFNSTEWVNSTTSTHNISAGWMELNGTGVDFNANFSGSTTYSRTVYPVFTTDLMTDNLSGGLVVAAEGNPTSGYRRHGIYIDKTDGMLKAQTYDLDGWHYKDLFTPETGKWYTLEVRFFATGSQLFVYSRDDSSRPIPDTADSTYNLTDWDPTFHFWTFDHTGYIDNTKVTTRTSTGTLPWVGDYIVTGLSSYSNLSTVNLSTILVADLNITVNTGDTYDLTIGNPQLNYVTINGTVQDNRSGIPRTSPVLVYVRAPDGIISVYNLAADTNGSFTLSFTRPSLIGTYDVTVTAQDTAGTTGKTDTSFDIQIGSTIAPTIETLNLMDTATLTVELFDDIIFDDMEQVTSNWSYRAGTTGTIPNMSEEVYGITRLYHKSGTQSQKVDYYVTKGVNDYLFLESGLGPIDVSQVNTITFWLYLDPVDAFDTVALVLENDPTGWSSDERIYGQNPVHGWNYYSFNVSDFSIDLTHDHYLTVLIDDDNSAAEVETRGSIYLDDLKVINGNPISGASISINVTKPGMSALSYSTPSDITDLGNGRYTFDFIDTDEYGNYTVIATSTSNGYSSTATTQFIVDRLTVTPVLHETPYIVGDTANISVSVRSNRSIPFDGMVYLNLTLPNGTSVNYDTADFIQSTENYARSGTASGSGFGSVARINDGSFYLPATTAACIGTYAGITWAQPVTINQVMVYYDTNDWPTSYRIQVLDTDGVTWVDKKVVDGFTTTSFPYIIDDIPTTTTRGVRVKYEASNNAQTIYIFEMWVYNTAATFTPTLPISGNYTARFNALDSKAVSGTSSIMVPVNFIVETIPYTLSYDPGDNATIAIKVFNGTQYVPGVSVSTQLSYIGNGLIIETNSTTTGPDGTVDVTYQLPADYSTYYLNSTVSYNGITGSDSTITSSAHLKLWIDPAEVLVGHPSWNPDLTPEEYRNISLHAEFLTQAGHILDDQSVTASIYRYDGTLITSLPLTEEDGLYTGNYTIPGNSPEGTYWVEMDTYPGIREYFSVMEWGCTRCHVDTGMGQNHYYPHTITSAAYGNSDGPVSPSNFSKEYVHEMHPLVDPSPPSTGSNCNYHSNARDVNCIKCHLTEALPSTCPDCHNSGQDTWSNVLSEDYGTDVHAGINMDIAKNKVASTSDGGNADLAIDGNEDTYWSPDGVSNQVMEIELDGAYSVDGVRIAMSNYKSTYTVEGLNNGSWVTLVSSTTYTNYDNDKLHTFTSQNITKVRFTVSSWSRVWTGTGYCSSPLQNAAVLTERPQVRSINVYLPNTVSLTVQNPDTHDACQVCHGGDIPNDIQPTIPNCTDCHPESSGSGMQVLPDNMSSVSRELEDYEVVSDISAYSAPGFPVSTVSLTASTDQVVQGNVAGKLDYSMALGVGRIYVDRAGLEFSNATSIKFWLYGNPADDNTQFQVSIRNNKS